MNRQQKVKLLNDLQTGKVSLHSILPPTIRHWFGNRIYGNGGTWTDEAGKQYGEDEIPPEGNNIYYIFHVDCGIPLAKSEDEIF